MGTRGAMACTASTRLNPQVGGVIRFGLLESLPLQVRAMNSSHGVVRPMDRVVARCVGPNSRLCVFDGYRERSSAPWYQIMVTDKYGPLHKPNQSVWPRHSGQETKLRLGNQALVGGVPMGMSHAHPSRQGSLSVLCIVFSRVRSTG